jgi:hypothetical protein
LGQVVGFGVGALLVLLGVGALGGCVEVGVGVFLGGFLERERETKASGVS